MPPPKDPIRYQIWLNKQKNRKVSEDTKEKIRNTLTGKPFTQEHCDNIRKGTIEKWADPEYHKQRNDVTTAQWEDPVIYAQRIEAYKRAWENPDIHASRCASARARWDTPGERERMSTIHKARCEDPEVIEIFRARALLCLADPIVRERISVGTKKALENPSVRHKMRERQLGEKSSQWKGGISFLPYCVKCNEFFKECVRAFYGYCCVECGNPQNGTRLAVHHVNYHKDSGCNPDVPMLFVALCPTIAGKPSCHSKTNHNRDYWENHFTEMINGYYQGKCYFTEEEMLAFTGAKL